MEHHENVIEWIVNPISDHAGFNLQEEKVCIGQCWKRVCEIQCYSACAIVFD